MGRYLNKDEWGNLGKYFPFLSLFFPLITNSFYTLNTYLLPSTPSSPIYPFKREREREENTLTSRIHNPGAAIKERGIITYSLSSNRQNLFNGAGRAAVFNTARRTRAQILYWLPPLLAAAWAMDWGNKR